MRISAIVPIIPNKLFRVVYDDNAENILDTLQDNWSDVEWLRAFFIQFQRDLHEIDTSNKIRAAVMQTKLDADQLFDKLLNADKTALSTIFKPLHHIKEPNLGDNQMQKGRLERSRSWLRLYAVHLKGKYIITGGAIKLTRHMKRPHLKAEINKLETLCEVLKEDTTPDSFRYLDV